VFSAISAACLAGSVLSVLSPWFLLLLIPFAVFGYIAAFLALTVYRFAPRGGDIQRHIHDLIVAKVEPAAASTALDVGCGSGSLVIKLAQASPGGTVTGVDAWGKDWEYSQRLCEDNARIEQIADRTAFQQHSGAALGFADGSFDVVVSCMTFHEIRDVARKSDAVVEALRVLRPGGRFVFLDLFADPSFYPSIDHVKQTISGAGVSISELHRLADLLPLPFPLRHPKALGHAVLIAGAKPGRPGTNS